MKKKNLYSKDISELEEENFREIRKTIKHIPSKNDVSNSNNHKKPGMILLCCVIALLVVCFVVGIVLSAGGNHKSANRTNEKGDLLIGTWSYDDVTIYSFDGNGHGILQLPLNTYEFSYIIEGGKVKIDFSDDSAEDKEYDYSVSDGVLMLIDANGMSYRFTEMV